LVLHLLAAAAGWGIVAMLSHVVPAGWIGGQIAAESRAPAKSGVRTLTAADTAAGQKLLQRVTAALPKDVIEADLGPLLSPEEFFEKARQVFGFDPAAPAPPWHDDSRTPEEEAAAREYQDLLVKVLGGYWNGGYGPDRAHAFRHGRIDAPALYESVARHLPGPAANDSLRIAAFHDLAPLDPVRAATLLQPLSDSAAAAVKYEVLRESPSAFTPDTAFALLSSIPPPADDSAALLRRDTWLVVAEKFHWAYGSDYLRWLEQLPAGVDRDYAAVALMAHLLEKDLPGYPRIRALVTESRMPHDYPPR
jgi:hypothetical protein